MSDRTVVTRLRLEYAQYAAGLSKLGADTRKLAVETATASQKHEASFKRIGLGASAAALAIGVGFYKAEKSVMGFDKQLSNVAAVSNATTAEMGRLRDAAIAAGANTKLAGVSASEAASSEAELVRAGVSVNEVLGGALVGSLQLASAGQLDFADAATIAAQAMNIFNLQGSDVGHVADVLAAAANKSAADVGQMGEALRQGGLVAAGANQDLEQTVGTLALFADHALIGSDAGTSLKTMLLQLQGPSAIAQKQMAEIGLSVYDANGQFVGMEELAKRLQGSLGGLSSAQRDAAISMIFGNDAARAARILYNAGADGVASYVKTVNDQGAAADMAAKQMDNLSGDVENLGGAIEAAILKNGSAATGGLRLLTQGATGLVNELGDVPSPLAATAGGLLAVTGAGLGVLGVAGTLIPRVRAARQALEDMGRAGEIASAGLGKAGTGIMVLGTTVGALFAVKAGLDALGWSAKGLQVDVEGAAKATTGELVLAFEKVSSFDPSEGLNLFRKLAEDSRGTALRLRDALVEAGASGPTIDQLNKILGDTAAASARAAADGKAAADTIGDVGGAASDAGGSVEGYGKALDALYASTFGVQDATNKFTEGLTEFADGVRAAQIEGDRLATSLDGATVSGARNQDALAGIVRQALDVADAMVVAGRSPQEIAAAMDQYRGMLVTVLQQLGFNTQQAQIYTDTLLRVPGSVTTTVDLKTDAAKAKLAELFSLLGGYMQEARDFDHAMKFGTPIPTVASSMVMPTVSLSGGLSDAVAGRGQQATQARQSAQQSGGGAAKKAADDAKQVAEERKRQEEELNRFLDAVFKQRMEILENQYKAGKISSDAYLKSLDEQMAREKPWTNEWVALQKKKEAVFTDAAEAITEAQRKAADEAEKIAKDQQDALEKATKAQDDAVERLQSLLDDEAKIRQQLADAAAAHRKKLDEIQQGYLADQRAALDERRDQLRGWVGIEERAQFNVASSVAAMTKNVRSQVSQFAEWADLLAAARRRGVSESVIGMLGLDEGPKALVQLRMFMKATDGEVVDLNNVVAARQAQTDDRVVAEQASTYSKLSLTLKGITERYAAEVETETEEFLAGQRSLNDELAKVGLDGGRSFGQALADGLNSSVPAIRAAAEAVRQAQQGANAAKTAAANVNVSGSTVVNGPDGRPINASQLAFFGVRPNPDGSWTVPVGSLPSHALGVDYVRTTGPANIHQGERILSAIDNRQLVAAVQSPRIDYGKLAAAVAGAAAWSGRGVEFTGPVVLRDGVDVDVLARRLSFAMSAGGIG